MGIETIILVFGVAIAVAISVGIAKTRRKLDVGPGTDHDPSVDPPAAPARKRGE